MVAQRLQYLSGKLFLGTRNASGRSDSLRFLGVVSELVLSPTEETIQHRDMTVPTRPVDSMIQTGTMAKLNIILDDTSSQNIALAFQGSITSTTAGTVTDESHTAPAVGGYFELDRNFIASVTSITPDPTGTAFVAGTDYVADPPSNLIYVPTGSALAGDPILVDYSALADDTIKGFNSPVSQYYLRYVGINSEDNKPVDCRFFKVRFPPASQMELISKDYQRYTLNCECLYDALNSASGGYYETIQTTAA